MPANRLAEVAEALKGQIAVDAKDAGNTLVDATGLQIPGVLDDLYTYDGALGATFGPGHVPTLRVWAPTARSVKLHLFADSNPATTAQVVNMTPTRRRASGAPPGNASWYGKYYLYEVKVFVRTTGQWRPTW